MTSVGSGMGSADSPRCVVIGAGVIGLSVAYELSRQRLRCTVLEVARTATQASWAAAGVLPTPHVGVGTDPTESLRQLSHTLHAEWSNRLRTETGWDNGFRQCGGIYLGRGGAEAAALTALMDDLRNDGGEVEVLAPSELARIEPTLSINRAKPPAIFRLPNDAQIWSQGHLQALQAACRQNGVEFVEAQALNLNPLGNDQVQVRHTQGSLISDYVCVAGGAWSDELLRETGVRTGIEPIRGQIIVWQPDRRLIGHILNEGQLYLLDRSDGLLLAGATVDDSGFDATPRDADLDDLRSFAVSWLPELAKIPVHATWVGLRSGSRRGRPYLGRIPGCPRILVASGHYRSGLHLAPATAVVIANIILEQPLPVDIAPYRISV